MDVDFSRERLDDAFEATGKLNLRVETNSGENLQQLDFGQVNDSYFEDFSSVRSLSLMPPRYISRHHLGRVRATTTSDDLGSPIEQTRSHIPHPPR